MWCRAGVGGQYNFVAMAHALHDGRSILMFHAIRELGHSAISNVLWNYGHATIPRHLRDIAVSEYGVVDLRIVNDEQCVKATLSICDARFIPKLMKKAKRELKLDYSFSSSDVEAMQRMNLHESVTLKEKFSAKLLSYALELTAAQK